jgi:hypothetical protein
MISAHEIHTIMNPKQAELEMLDKYRTLQLLEQKAKLSSHIPYSLDVETFNRAEAYFIHDYFGGSQDKYNAWRKEVNKNVQD